MEYQTDLTDMIMCSQTCRQIDRQIGQSARLTDRYVGQSARLVCRFFILRDTAGIMKMVHSVYTFFMNAKYPYQSTQEFSGNTGYFLVCTFSHQKKSDITTLFFFSLKSLKLSFDENVFFSLYFSKHSLCSEIFLCSTFFFFCVKCILFTSLNDLKN